MIEQIQYKHKRTGTRWHQDKGAWIGYRVDVYISGVRYRNRRFPTKSEAEKYIENLKLENTYKRSGVKFSRSEAPRLSELSAKRLDRIKTPAERSRAVRIFKYFENLFESDQKVFEIRTAHLQNYINARAEDGVKPETINREMNILSTLLKTAAEIFPEALEDFEPPRIPRPRFKKTGRTRVVTEEEKDLICNYLTREKKEDETQKVFENRRRIARMFEVGWLLGLRFGEVARLEKKDFNFAARRLSVFRHKTGTTTVFDFLPEFICEKIKTAADDSRTQFIYTITGNYPKLFYPILREAVEAVGLEYGRDNPNGITFHSNRHSFTTRLIQTTDLATAASFTGHSTGEMVAHYSHASQQSRKKAMENLYGKEKTELTDGELRDGELRDIFAKIVAREMTFTAFCAALKGEKFKTKGTN